MIILKLIMALCIASTAYAGDITYTKYPNGLLKTKTYASGFVVSLKYGKNGKLTEVRKSNGTKIMYKYDGKKNLTQVQRNDGFLLWLTYDKKGRIVGLFTENAILKITYEPVFGKPDSIQLNNFKPLGIIYDANGNILSLKNPNGYVVSLLTAQTFNSLLTVTDPKHFMAEE